MLKERVNRCVLLRVCVLLCVLCVCAHVYVEFKGSDLKSRKSSIRLQQDTKRQVSKAASKLSLSDWKPTCCPPVRRHRKVRFHCTAACLVTVQQSSYMDLLPCNNTLDISLQSSATRYESICKVRRNELMKQKVDKKGLPLG